MTQSPYKYIGTNKAGARVVRTDLILLDGLANCTEPASIEALLEISDPRNLAKLDEREALMLLTEMVADGYVERDGSIRSYAQMIHWKITEKGKAHLIAKEAEEIFEDLARYTHIRPNRRKDPLTIQEAPVRDASSAEARLHAQLLGSHARLDADGVPPAVATVCLSEEELDDWWDELEVDVKAAAFCEFHLGNRPPRKVHTSERPIPVVGVIGEDGTVTVHPQGERSAETNDALGELARRAAVGTK